MNQDELEGGKLAHKRFQTLLTTLLAVLGAIFVSALFLNKNNCESELCGLIIQNQPSLVIFSAIFFFGVLLLFSNRMSTIERKIGWKNEDVSNLPGRQISNVHKIALVLLFVPVIFLVGLFVFLTYQLLVDPLIPFVFKAGVVTFIIAFVGYLVLVYLAYFKRDIAAQEILEAITRALLTKPD